MFRRVTVFATVLVALCTTAWAADKRQTDRDALRAAVDELLAHTALAQSRVSVHIVSLDDGSVIYSHFPDDLLNPASNVKLFTTAAALARLGPEYRFETEFLVDPVPAPDPRSKKSKAPAKPGEIKGNLYVRGKADPSLTSEKLFGIVNDLYYAGLRSIGGDLVLDDTYFDSELVGPGFDQERSDRTYLAPPSALSLNWNTVDVYVSPGGRPGAKANIELRPASDFFLIDNRAVTGSERALRRLSVASIPAGDKQSISVTGRIPLRQTPAEIIKKIDNPTIYFGHSLKAALALRGIQLKGKVRRAPAREDAVQILLHQSDSLDLILKRANKNSSNFTAEQLIKALGAQAAGSPGSWPSGVRVVEQFLRDEVGIPSGTYVMKNGSGLNDTNRFSTRQICQLLRFMWLRFPLAPEYLSSLGIAGKDGTLHWRMEGTDAVGRLRAKTGTLENVSALSGYVQAVGGERFAFSIIANDFPGRLSRVVSALDAIGAAIASVGATDGPAAVARASLIPTTAAQGPLEDLKARIATWDSLARKHDRRNATFLRTALRAEHDPTLRAVLADAVFRSDPEDSGSVRTLLEALEPASEVFTRLREVARSLSIATPVLASLARLAGEGNTDALSLLVELGPLAKSDDDLSRELMEPVVEIARNAPDELIAALRAARDPVREAALELVARSLLQAGEPDHPFPASLSRTRSSADPQTAAFAKSLEEGLSVRMAAQKGSQASTGSSPAGSSEKPPPAQAAESKPGGN
jgi:D-alanyl-D-alanine carboxypeptidase/D-alanyl-D-alanine-endopeptidase (penicillin-binding protein 4)